MIASFGLAALWFAAALAILQLIAGGLSLARDTPAMTDLVRPVAVAQGLMVAVAFIALVHLFCVTDLSVLLVAKNSHSATPFLDKFAGIWGTHEGAMLLWVTVMGLAGCFIALVERGLPERTILATLTTQAFVSVGFYAVLLFALNPFARARPVPDEGLGFNLLLQDPGLVLKQIACGVGYAGLSVAFSFAFGAWITGVTGSIITRTIRIWVLSAWIFLTIGILAGYFWRPVDLVQLGSQFWNPVVHAGLIPWLAATALLHVSCVKRAIGNQRPGMFIRAALAGDMQRHLRSDTAWLNRRAMILPMVAALGGLIMAAKADLPVLSVLGLGLSAGLVIASLQPLGEQGLRASTLPLWGRGLAHLGIAVALLGTAMSSAHSVEGQIGARPGEMLVVGPWKVSLDRVDPIAGPNWTALQATLLARYDGGAPIRLEPQARTFWSPQNHASESASATRWNGQFVAVLGAEAADGRWPLRFWWKPFVTFVWLGGGLATLGGLLALIGRVLSDLRRSIAQEKIAYRRMRQGR